MAKSTSQLSDKSSSSGEERTVRILIAGDVNVGKTTLLLSLMTEKFPEGGVPAVLPEVSIPSKYNPDNVNVLLIDSSAGLPQIPSDINSVILVYDASNTTASLERLKSYWLPLITSFNVSLPIILAGSKIDLRGRDQSNSLLEEQIVPLMNSFRNVETCIECSSKSLMNVAEVFYFALKAVMHPSAPLFDAQNDMLKPACLRALKRIFRHCDVNGDGFLDDNELNEFQKKCFNKTLSSDEITAIKDTVREQLPEGVEKGISEAGFLVLNRLFVQRGRLETTWTILRSFGYNDQLEIEVPDIQLPPDTVLEFTSLGIRKLTELFNRFANGKDHLTNADLTRLFSLTEDNRNPWFDQYPATAELTDNNKNLPMDSYLAQWMLFIYELPYEAIRSFSELFHPRMIKKAFKTIPYEKYWQRRIFKVAILSPSRGEELIKLFNAKSQSKAVKKIHDHYLILSLIEAQPDLCDLIICDQQIKNVLGTPYTLAKDLENRDGTFEGELVFKKILDTIKNQ